MDSTAMPAMTHRLIQMDFDFYQWASKISRWNNLDFTTFHLGFLDWFSLLNVFQASLDNSP